MKTTDRLQFVYRFLNVAQKKELRKIAEKKNNSLNQEVSLAIDNHIEKQKKCKTQTILK